MYDAGMYVAGGISVNLFDRFEGSFPVPTVKATTNAVLSKRRYIFA